MRNPPTKEKLNYKETNTTKYKVKQANSLGKTNPLELDTANQSTVTR